jgi:hypothetical protein
MHTHFGDKSEEVQAYPLTLEASVKNAQLLIHSKCEQIRNILAHETHVHRYT